MSDEKYDSVPVPGHVTVLLQTQVSVNTSYEGLPDGNVERRVTPFMVDPHKPTVSGFFVDAGHQMDDPEKRRAGIVCAINLLHWGLEQLLLQAKKEGIDMIASDEPEEERDPGDLAPTQASGLA